MSDQPSTHVLAASRARTGEDPLLGYLRGARNTDVALSAQDVMRLDAQRLQTLLVAERQWAIDGHAFSLTDMSDNFRAGLERLGLATDHFDKDAPQ